MFQNTHHKKKNLQKWINQMCLRNRIKIKNILKIKKRSITIIITHTITKNRNDSYNQNPKINNQFRNIHESIY